MSEAIQILDLEKKLADDDSGTCRDQLCEALRSDLAEVKRHLNQGLAPDEFQQAGQVASAIETAITVVERFWESSPARTKR